ncbi:60S ribosomal protein L10a [Babesia sp. Xinjiang]|uniref:60S ribosomal protein L10a n=1 Tax=Babesia sp. Xinjiang TaxID=462227 RepID=UPI000A232423|nr:60S ribosomal protein L10a [Babesia sp. Xinjiang]ORM41064.1 60S ribosomal protein L10a [Babesia sp. Xinjiang]
MSKLTLDTLNEAISAILTQSQEKKRKFVETVELQISLKDYDTQRDKRFSGTVVLQNVPRQRMKVCVFGDQVHCDQAKSLGIDYIDLEGLKKFNRNKTLVKKLANKYGAFLASQTLLPQIPRFLGPGLNKAGKFPTQITHNDNMEDKVREIKASVKFQLKKVLCMGVAVGNVEMTHEQLRANIVLAINYLVSLLKKNWQNRCARRNTVKMATGNPVLVFGGIRRPETIDTGAFKVSTELFGWKNKRTGEVIQHRRSDVQRISLINTGAGMHQVRFEMNASKEHEVLRFCGFTEKAIGELKQHFEEHFKVPTTVEEVTHSGWHWGTYDFDNNTFKFKIDEDVAIDIDAKSVSQVTVPAKTDLAVELKPTHGGNAGDELVEIRFCMPNKPDAEDNELLLEDVKQTFLLKAGLDELKSETVALLTDVPLIVPRGRFEIEFTRKHIKLHGKSYDYTMFFTNISRMFLVPKPNSPHINFVLGLHQAMRQGQTKYPYVVMQFDAEEDVELEINMPQTDLEAMKLEKLMTGKTFNVVTKLFGTLVNKPIVVPGEFKSDKGESGFSCTYKATSGYMFPLNRSLLFIVKPVIFIRFDDIISVEFSRTGVSTQNRFFAFSIATKFGQEFEFTNIDRAEFEPLSKYLSSREVKIKRLEEAEKAPAYRTAPLDDDEEDDDEEVEDEDFEDEEGKMNEGNLMCNASQNPTTTHLKSSKKKKKKDERCRILHLVTHNIMFKSMTNNKPVVDDDVGESLDTSGHVLRCKWSSVQAGYVKDDFIQYMVTGENQGPVHNILHFLRITSVRFAISAFVRQFPDEDLQIVNFGCGFDTVAFWVLQHYRNATCFELDLPEQLEKKAKLMKNAEPIMRLLSDYEDDGGTLIVTLRYKMVGRYQESDTTGSQLSSRPSCFVFWEQKLECLDEVEEIVIVCRHHILGVCATQPEKLSSVFDLFTQKETKFAKRTYTTEEVRAMIKSGDISQMQPAPLRTDWLP